MAVNWGDIYEAIYLCGADTVIADAFRRAVGLPKRHKRGCRIAYDLLGSYHGVDFERLMKQRHGVSGL